MKVIIKTYLFITVFLLTPSADTGCFAQQPVKRPFSKDSFYIHGKTRLDSLTKYVHRLSGIRFSFNASKVKGSQEIVFPRGEYSFPALLERIRKTTSLYYTCYNGYVIFRNKPRKRKPAGGCKHGSACRGQGHTGVVEYPENFGVLSCIRLMILLIQKN